MTDKPWEWKGKKRSDADKDDTPIAFLVPHKIQRIACRKPVYDKQDIEPLQSAYPEDGLDDAFVFDYMGNAHFEFGSLPAALKRLQECKAPPVSAKISAHGKDAWLVGETFGIGAAEIIFEDQLRPHKERELSLKEETLIASAYGLEEGYASPIGWWAIDEHKPNWALFKEQVDAEEWLRIVYGNSYKPEETSKTRRGTLDPPTLKELECLIRWPNSTVGYASEKEALQTLLNLCHRAGFGRICQLAVQIEDIWRHPEKEVKYLRDQKSFNEKLLEATK